MIAMYQYEFLDFYSCIRLSKECRKYTHTYLEMTGHQGGNSLSGGSEGKTLYHTCNFSVNSRFSESKEKD